MNKHKVQAALKLNDGYYIFSKISKVSKATATALLGDSSDLSGEAAQSGVLVRIKITTNLQIALPGTDLPSMSYCCNGSRVWVCKKQA